MENEPIVAEGAETSRSGEAVCCTIRAWLGIGDISFGVRALQEVTSIASETVGSRGRIPIGLVGPSTAVRLLTDTQ